MKIIHIGDLHFKLNNLMLYAPIIENFKAKVHSIAQHDSIIAVIAGDILDTYRSMSFGVVQVVCDLITFLLDYGEVVMITGNHDFNRMDRSKEQLLKFSIMVNKMVKGRSNSLHFFNKTGCYVVSDIAFAICSLSDREKTFIRYEEARKIVNRSDILCIFHGMVYEVIEDDPILKLHIDTKEHSSPSGERTRRNHEFNGYSAVIMGDIHKHGHCKYNKNMVYCGSMMQLHYAEDNTHGFVVWDYSNGSISWKFEEIMNNHEFVSINLESQSMEYVLDRIQRIKGNEVSVKVIYNDVDKLETIMRAIRERGCAVISNEVVPTKDIIASEPILAIELYSCDLAEINTKLRNREFDYINHLMINGELNTEFNTRLFKLHEETLARADEKDFNYYHLESMTLDGFMSYYNKTQLDFSSWGNVVVVTGNNMSGKSSIRKGFSWAIHDFRGTNPLWKPDDYVNAEKNTATVELKIRDVEGNIYGFKRTKKRGGSNGVATEPKNIPINFVDSVRTTNFLSSHSTNNTRVSDMKEILFACAGMSHIKNVASTFDNEIKGYKKKFEALEKTYMKEEGAIEQQQNTLIPVHEKDIEPLRRVMLELESKRESLREQYIELERFRHIPIEIVPSRYNDVTVVELVELYRQHRRSLHIISEYDRVPEKKLSIYEHHLVWGHIHIREPRYDLRHLRFDDVNDMMTCTCDELITRISRHEQELREYQENNDRRTRVVTELNNHVRRLNEVVQLKQNLLNTHPNLRNWNYEDYWQIEHTHRLSYLKSLGYPNNGAIEMPENMGVILARQKIREEIHALQVELRDIHNDALQRNQRIITMEATIGELHNRIRSEEQLLNRYLGNLQILDAEEKEIARISDKQTSSENIRDKYEFDDISEVLDDMRVMRGYDAVVTIMNSVRNRLSPRSFQSVMNRLDSLVDTCREYQKICEEEEQWNDTITDEIEEHLNNLHTAAQNEKKLPTKSQWSSIVRIVTNPSNVMLLHYYLQNPQAKDIRERKSVLNKEVTNYVRLYNTAKHILEELQKEENYLKKQKFFEKKGKFNELIRASQTVIENYTNQISSCEEQLQNMRRCDGFESAAEAYIVEQHTAQINQYEAYLRIMDEENSDVYSVSGKFYSDVREWLQRSFHARVVAWNNQVERYELQRNIYRQWCGYDAQIAELRLQIAAIEEQISAMEEISIETMNNLHVRINRLREYIRHMEQTNSETLKMLKHKQRIQRFDAMFLTVARNKVTQDTQWVQEHQHAVLIEECKLWYPVLYGRMQRIKVELRDIERDYSRVKTEYDIMNNKYREYLSAQNMLQEREGKFMMLKRERDEAHMLWVVAKEYQTYVIKSSNFLLHTYKPFCDLITHEVNVLLSGIIRCKFVMDIVEYGTKLDLEMILENPLKPEERRVFTNASGYEGTVCELALRAVINKYSLVKKYDILFIDDTVQVVDEHNISNFVTFLTRLRNYYGRLIIITHNPILQQLAETIVEVRNVNERSQVTIKHFN